MYRSIALFALLPSVGLAAPTFVTPLERTTNLDPRDGDDPFDSRIEFGYYTIGSTADLGQQNVGEDRTIEVNKVAEYSSTMHVIEPRLKIGLMSRLMIYADLPIVLSWEQTWKATAAYQNAETMYGGVQPPADDEPTDYPNGLPRATRTPAASLQPGYSSSNTTHRSGIGDLNVGFAFDMLSEIADPSKPTWHWQFNAQLPTGDDRELVYAGVDEDGSRTGTVGVNATSSSPGGVSEGIYRFTTRTVLARWVGKFRPYFAVDYSFGMPATNDYDSHHLYDEEYGSPAGMPANHLAEDCVVANQPVRQLYAACRNKTQDFGTDGKRSIDYGAGLAPQHIGGSEFGVSTGLWTTGGKGMKSYVKGDLLVRAEYVSEGRGFNRMSDLLGRPTAEEQFARIGINAGLRFATAGMLEARLLGAYGTESSHYTTFEDIGKADDKDPNDANPTTAEAQGSVGKITQPYEYSPYYRESFDGVGNRFKLLDNSFYSVSLDLRIRF